MEISFTDRELDVMTVLWRNGSGTVAEVRDALSTDFAYTTVLTVLRTLEDKGFVGHTSEGKAHRYVPLVRQNEAGQSALSRLLDTVFDGSRELLLTQLVSDRDVDATTLRQLRDLLNERIAAKKGKR
jgi:predicted transcriptional regulator